ncbi:MAG: hypothetical protein M3M89_03195 [Thermoproteota archaeon]|nr:hypothetical protein [Thermoproteota archaeon]
MDSPINNRMLSLKLTEQQIRNNYNIRSAKAARTSSRDYEPAIISTIVSAVVAIAILTVRSLIMSLTDGVETFPQFRKMALQVYRELIA